MMSGGMVPQEWQKPGMDAGMARPSKGRTSGTLPDRPAKLSMGGQYDLEPPLDLSAAWNPNVMLTNPLTPLSAGKNGFGG